MRSIFKQAFLCCIILLPSLCHAQLNTPKSTAPKPATTSKPVEKYIYTKAGTVTDIDGNVYKAIKIGTQVWMAANLKTLHYNDGSAIPNVTNNDAWYNLTTGAWCYYDNDASYNNTYGKLYNWYAVKTGKLAPKGWHVPTYEEWNALINYLGGEEKAGAKLKSTSALWNNPNTGANNMSGYNALPNGFRNWNGDFMSKGSGADFWSSSDHGVYEAWTIGMGYTDIGAYGHFLPNNNGYAIRCIKD